MQPRRQQIGIAPDEPELPASELCENVLTTHVAAMNNGFHAQLIEKGKRTADRRNIAMAVGEYAQDHRESKPPIQTNYFGKRESNCVPKMSSAAMRDRFLL